MKVTLGGERLGSGKKMQVDLHNYERSTHDLGYIWRSTMSAGTLVPFLSEVGLPGDTFDIDLSCIINTHPTIGPLFGSFKVQLDVFIAPYRLYNPLLHNNTLDIGRQMSQVKLPVINLRALTFTPDDVPDIDNAQINPSCLLAYLGIRGVAYVTAETEPTFRYFNGVPILAYWEIYKNYYSNKQEAIGAVIHTPAVALVQTVDQINVNTTAIVAEAPATSNVPVLIGDEIRIQFTGAQPIPSQIIMQTNQGLKSLEEIAGPFSLLSVGVLIGNAIMEITLVRWNYATTTTPTNGKPAIATFDLANIDSQRSNLLASDGTSEYIINGTLEPYVWLGQLSNNIPNALSSQEGLALKTYQSDLFNNWLKTENIDAITSATAISTAGASFTIDQLSLARKVYNMLNRINVSGGSYNDWQDAVYMHDRVRQVESPMYMGGLIKELIFQEVVSNSESTTGQPLGTLAGKGKLAEKHKGGQIVIHVDEISHIIGIVSLTPRIDYSQGNKWEVHLKTMDDFHKPALDQIGFQDLTTEQMAWWETHYNNGTPTVKSAGKQPAWVNYMTNINRTYGNFAIKNNQMFMTLNRRYENNPAGNPEILDLTTYIDPSKFNYIFAQTSLDAQNFWVQIGVDITARRKMSAKIMPNL